MLNVRLIIFSDLEWVENNRIDKEKVSGFHTEPKQTFVVMNRGLPTECRTSFFELINKLPCDEEGKNKVFIQKYDDAYIEYEDIVMRIKGVKFEYDVQFSHEQQHIDAMNMAKAVMNNVISGDSLLIDIRNMVSDFGNKNDLAVRT